MKVNENDRPVNDRAPIDDRATVEVSGPVKRDSARGANLIVAIAGSAALASAAAAWIFALAAIIVHVTAAALLVATTRVFTAAVKVLAIVVRTISTLLGLSVLAGIALGGAALHSAHSAAGAAWLPSSELSFRITLSPDSITVGDPMTLAIEAAGPAGASLLLPELGDSIGPFVILSAEPARARSNDDGASARQEARVTLFRTGGDTLPSLPLLWVRAPGETLSAWSAPIPVRVASVLEGEASLQNLRGLKGVVPLSRPRWWLWIGIAVAAAALAYAAWRWHPWLRKQAGIPAAIAPPPLPPEIAFEQGLEALLSRGLPEAGEVKEFYAELSLLLRRYLEGRFAFPAVEETRTEILASAAREAALDPPAAAMLADWLAEGDLVKFAKLDRLVVEAHAYTERAREFVLTTTRAAKEAAAKAAREVEATNAESAAPTATTTHTAPATKTSPPGESAASWEPTPLSESTTSHEREADERAPSDTARAAFAQNSPAAEERP